MQTAPGYNIIPFKPLHAAEDMWAAYLALQDQLLRELDPDDPLLPRAKRRELIRNGETGPYNNKYHYLMLASGGQAAGYAFAWTETPKSPSYDTNKAVANFRLSISPALRRQGLGTKLYRHLAAQLTAAEPQLKELVAAVMTGPGFGFIEKLGGKVSLEHGENRLYCKDVNWPLVQAWAAKGAAANPAAEVMTVTSIPEQDIAEYAEIYSEVINQQPMGDLPITMKISPAEIRHHEETERKVGGEHVTIYVKEANGAISGLTEIFYQPEAGHRAMQLLTGVRSACRGRGLGKMLKALMLLHIRTAYPGMKYIITGNAPANAPMMAINDQLGFKKHRKVTIYRVGF